MAVKSLFNSGRILLGLTFVLDGFWNVLTYDTRALYLDEIGAPHFLTIVTALVYIVFGSAVMASFKIRQTPIPLALMLLLMSLVLLTQFDGTGIGDYPPELHGEVLFKEWVVHIAIIGSLTFLVAQSASGGHDQAPLAKLSRTGVVARATIGSYFIVNALWQWYYFDIRIEHIQSAGGNGGSLPYIIGLQLICGSMVAAGIWMKAASLPLMFIITLSTIIVHGNLSDTAPYPANLQIHQWFVKAAILAGLMMVLGHYNTTRTSTRPMRS